MGRSVIYKTKHFAMTKSMTIDFLKPIYIGTELKAEGRVIEIKGEREILAEGLIFNKAEVLCARARGTFTFFKPHDSKKLGIKDDAADVVDWLGKE
jgi:acyl-coenzyme A thioesterase PaaI-like protein